MNRKLKKVLLLLLALCLLAGTGFVQNSMNRDRDRLGLTRVQPLKNAPPVLAFTTVALGGFRGLISNVLWIRANDLQDDDKFFEMAQLADWITKLEPHFVQVWLVQAWNMAYNISVKFKDYPDRWRWVQRGISLLRDEGLPYNPNELIMYRDLAWLFQHKMGANMDDASLYYKQQWAIEMSNVFGKQTKIDLQQALNPNTEDGKKRRELLESKYKMDPDRIMEFDKQYGPLEWRLPESHAIYWAAMGLRAAAHNPAKVKKEDMITLRRTIYQSMQMSFQRGRLVENPFAKRFEFGPNLDIIPKVVAAYEQAAEEDVENRDHILIAYRNFFKDAIYFLYTYNRMDDAMKWFKYVGQKFPDKPLIEGRPQTLPRNITLNQYAVARVQENVGELDRNRVQAILEGLLNSSYISLILDQQDRYEGLQALARQVWESYTSKVPKDRVAAIGLRPLPDIAGEIVRRLLDKENGIDPEAQAILRTRLNLPAETKPETPPATQPAPAPTAAALP